MPKGDSECTLLELSNRSTKRHAATSTPLALRFISPARAKHFALGPAWKTGRSARLALMAASHGPCLTFAASLTEVPMSKPQKQNAGIKAGANVDLAGGLESTNQNTSTAAKFNTGANILANKSTSTDVQLAKVLALLRQGPKTTIELRQHGIMMPAARVFTLKREHKQNIVTELLALYDAEGIRHSKCARYHLIPATTGEVPA